MPPPNSISAGALPHDPAGGAYSTPSDSLAGYKGAYTSKGRERRKDGREWQGREEREGRGPTSNPRGEVEGSEERGGKEGKLRIG